MLIAGCAHFAETSTLTGLVKLARWSLATLVVIVAENRYVVRSLGSILRILSLHYTLSSIPLEILIQNYMNVYMNWKLESMASCWYENYGKQMRFEQYMIQIPSEPNSNSA